MQLYDRYHCKSAAFITGYNPASQELSIAENIARNKNLEQLIQSLNYQF